MAALVKRVLAGMHQAQHKFRFDQARALAATLACVGDPTQHFWLRRSGLFLAQQLALVECDFVEARRWDAAVILLHSRQIDQSRRRLAHAKAHRLLQLEFGACPAAAEQAHSFLRLPPRQALRPLLAALEQEPQATALAYALLLVLRRGGWFEQPAFAPNTPATPGPIPPNLWLLRLNNQSTEAAEQRKARWQALHPGWEAHWLDHQPEAIKAMSALPELVRQVCLCVGDPVVRGDLLRLAMVWQHGGVAIDFGIAPSRSLCPLLAEAELLLLQDGLGAIGTDLLAAPPRHPWVEAALVQACRNVIEGQGFRRWDLTGSCLLSGITARWLRPQLAALLPLDQLLSPAITVLAPVEQNCFFQLGPPEPCSPDVQKPRAVRLLDRRSCNHLREQWGRDLPPL